MKKDKLAHAFIGFLTGTWSYFAAQFQENIRDLTNLECLGISIGCVLSVAIGKEVIDYILYKLGKRQESYEIKDALYTIGAGLFGISTLAFWLHSH